MKRVFVSDCEGPISKNDNAYELTVHFVPDGDKLFALISKYDDVLADILKRPGYNAGDTLKLILPFLKAYDVTDLQMQEFSARTLVLIAGSTETLKQISGKARVFIVSTSYEHYIKALCIFVNFPFENTYCTRLRIDKYSLTEQEKSKLKSLVKEIVSMPMITIPHGAMSLKDFPIKDKETVIRLDQIFWKEIPATCCGKILSEVKTVGGEQKAQAVLAIAKKTGVALSEVIYVGDSITDVQAFQLVRNNGGLTVSFNGNGYALREAEVSVMSESNIVIAVLADVFLSHGKAQTLKMAENWTTETVRAYASDLSLLDRFFAVFSDALPKVQIVTQANMESLSKESSEFRKRVRGEAVGKLG